MSDFDLKWFLLGALTLWAVQRFLGILVTQKKASA